jgi:hypothetical protein
MYSYSMGHTVIGKTFLVGVGLICLYLVITRMRGIFKVKFFAGKIHKMVEKVVYFIAGMVM